LAARLRGCRAEIEQALLARVNAVADSRKIDDPTYALGLNDAVRAGLDHTLETIESGRRAPPHLPPALLAQARLAARNGVSLDVVLRRYSAGYALLGDFFAREAESVDGADLKGALSLLSATFDHIVASVATEHAREARADPTPAHRRAEPVKMLLEGKPIAPSELGYELAAWHVAAVGAGPGSLEAIRCLATAMGRRLLAVPVDEDLVWAWLGCHERPAMGEMSEKAGQFLPAEVGLALGEPGEGVVGWRLSHRQAKAASSVMLPDSDRLVRYADVALLASALRDDLLAKSLDEVFLVPLSGERDGGATLRQTLRAYFDAESNVSSTALVLGVSRQTVNSRLRAVERQIGRRLSSCIAELQTALRLRSIVESPSQTTF
jgi:hypothetical protein